MAERTVRVRLEAITAAYEQAMGKAAKATDQLVGKVNGLDSKKLQSVGKDMSTKLTLPIVAAMGLAAKSASDLQQAVGGTEAVFGEAGEAINDYAKTAASASGLSEREFREATTSIGGQLKRMTGDVDLAAEQSMKLTGVAADLAATYGGTTAEAVQALGSAFRGEADPAERFNLNLKIGAVNAKAVEMGLAATTSEVDDNARAQATLALIMEQSADATGQFARESDSAAGSMQIAKAEMENATAEIGSALLPALSDLAGGVADVARIFGDLPGSVQNGLLAIAGITAVAGPVMSFTGKIMDMSSRLRDADGNLTRTGNAAKGFGKALGALGIAAIVLDLQRMMTEASKAKHVLNNVADIDTTKVEDLQAAFEDLFYDPDSAQMSSETFARQFRELADESLVAAEAILEMVAADEKLQSGLSEGGVTVESLTGIIDESTEARVRSAGAAEREAEIVGEATGATEVNTGAVEEAVDAQERLEESIKNVTNAIRSQLDPLFAAQDAFATHKELQDDLKWANLELFASGEALAEAIKAEGRESDLAAAAWHRQLEAQRQVDELNGKVVRSALDVAAASAELKLRVDDGSVSLETAEAQLRDWVTQGLITADQAWRTAEELRGTAGAADSLAGRNIAIPVKLEGYELVMAQIGVVRNAISTGGGWNIRARLGDLTERKTGGPIPGGQGQAVPILAHGGEYVLSADVVNAIKHGRPSAGLPGLAPGAGGGPSSVSNNRNIGEVHNHFYGQDGPNPVAAIAWAVA